MLSRFLGRLQIHLGMGKAGLEVHQRGAGLMQHAFGGLVSRTFAIEILTHGLDQRLVLLDGLVRSGTGSSKSGMDDRNLAIAHVPVA